MQEDNNVQIRSFLEGIRIRLGLENKESTPEKSDVQIGSLLEEIRFRLGLENKESILDLRNDGPSTPPQELVAAPDPMVLFTDAREKFQSTMKSGLDGLRDEIRELRVAFHEEFNEIIQKIVNSESESIPVTENSDLSIDDVLGAKSIQERDSMVAEELSTKTELFDEVTEQAQSQSQVPNYFLESRPGNRMLSELGMGLVFSDKNMGIKHVEDTNFDDILEISRVFQEESLEAQQMERIDVLHVENVAEIFELLTSIMISLSAYQLFDNMFSRGRIEIQQMIVRKMPKSWKFKYKRRRNQHQGTDSNGNTELLEAIGDIEEQQEILIQHQKVEFLQLQLFNGKDAANIVWWLLHDSENKVDREPGFVKILHGHKALNLHQLRFRDSCHSHQLPVTFFEASDHRAVVVSYITVVASTKADKGKETNSPIKPHDEQNNHTDIDGQRSGNRESLNSSFMSDKGQETDTGKTAGEVNQINQIDYLSLEQLSGDNQLSVEDFCENCNARVDDTCCIKLHILSPVLTFQLKRGVSGLA